MSNTKYLVIFIFSFWHLSFAKCIFPVETLRWRPRTSDELFASLKSKSGNTIYYVFYEIKYRLEAEYAQTIKSEQEKSVISDLMKKCTELLQEPSLDSVFVNLKTDNNFDDIDILQGDTLFTASCSDVAILPHDTLMIALNIVSVGYAYGNKTAVDFVNNYLADYIANSKSEYLKLIWKNSFRIENHVGDKIVIMYSGNHSVMHPLNTLLEAAVKLKEDNRFIFVHIGGGIRLQEVKEYKKKFDLNNVVLLPYQPRENIHISLGSSDIQVVSLGDKCVGYTHPNKIYGAMFIGKPIIYIGPNESHITEILDKCDGNISVRHGEYNKLVELLIRFAETTENQRINIGKKNRQYAETHFHPKILLSNMVTSIEEIIV